MPSYNINVTVPSCTVTKPLISAIEEFLKVDALRILQFENTEQVEKRLKYGTTIYDSIGEESLVTIAEHKLSLLNNDTKSVAIEFHIQQSSDDIIKLDIKLKLSKTKDSSDLSISLNCQSAKDKLITIRNGIFTILDQHKNFNWILYPHLLIIGIAGGIAGSGFFIMFNGPYVLKNIYALYLFLLTIYFFIFRALKGYCVFETRKQKQLDKLFTWIALGVLGFLIFGTALPVLRKMLFGF